MAAVVGYLVAATVAVAAALLVAGPRYVAKRDPSSSSATSPRATSGS